MNECSYSKEEIAEIEKLARKFKKKNFFKLPALVKGNKVASRNPESKIRNFSTITKVFKLSTGKWVYLVYFYPLSIIHRILDGIGKWATEKYSLKIMNPKKWKETFISNSFIPVIPINVLSVVAMPYIENENLFDIFSGRIGKYSFLEKIKIIKNATDLINRIHSRGIVWGELIVHNMIRTVNGEIVLCDTETVYYRGTLIEQKASDWINFIFSTCGAMSKTHIPNTPTFYFVAFFIFSRIENEEIKEEIKKWCRRKKNFLHKLFFFYDAKQLSCLPDLYKRLKKIISEN